MTIAPQLLTITTSATPHPLAPAPEAFFDGLPPELGEAIMPLALLDGRALGLPVPAVPIVYHETFGLPDALELEPSGERFVLHLPSPAEVVEMEIPAAETLERLRGLGRIAPIPFASIPPRPSKLYDRMDAEWRAYRQASDAHDALLDPDERARFLQHDARPSLGHLGGRPAWLQAHAARGAVGEFLVQVQAAALGLCELSFYVYWDRDRGRFRQAHQFT